MNSLISSFDKKIIIVHSFFALNHVNPCLKITDNDKYHILLMYLSC